MMESRRLRYIGTTDSGKGVGIRNVKIKVLYIPQSEYFVEFIEIEIVYSHYSHYVTLDRKIVKIRHRSIENKLFS